MGPPRHASLPPLAEGAPATEEPGGWGVPTNAAWGTFDDASALILLALEPLTSPPSEGRQAPSSRKQAGGQLAAGGCGYDS